MKFKTSAIALAVAGTVAAPVVAQADDGAVYASARIGLEHVDTGGVADFRVRSLGSRFGARGETDLGNGMTGFGRYEWDVDFKDHNADTDDDIDIRHRYVGVKGDWGSITLGQAYHTYYNHVYGATDAPWWGSGYYYSSPGRTDGGITYAGGTGAIGFGVTGYFDREADEDAPDRMEVGFTVGLGDMTLGLGARTFQDSADDPTTDQDESENILGVVLSGIGLGDVSIGVGFQNQDERDEFVINVGWSNMYFHYEMASTDDADPYALTVGYTQGLGRNTTMWYEFVTTDADSGNSDDDNQVARAVLKYDIL